ncbi:MAG: hypothetical protein KDE09_15480, partial [Anaerolineales bacterium]|nr:hypothetical protein [Anaerolineales bacterium]
ENPADRRVQLLQATPRGEQLLQEGRQRRVAALAADINGLTEAERAALTAAIPILQQLSLPADHPHRQSA